jgi:hypothetical protein
VQAERIDSISLYDRLFLALIGLALRAKTTIGGAKTRFRAAISA